MKNIYFITLLSLCLVAQGQDIVWQKTLGGSNNEVELFSYLDEEGILYIGGNSNSDDFAPFGPLQNDDGLMLKLGDFANIQEGFTYGGTSTDEFFSMCIIGGEHYFFGTSYSTDGDVNNEVQEADAWLLKTDMNGEILWSKLIGGTAPDFGMDMKATADGAIVCTILSSSSDEDLPLNSGVKDAWVIKVDSEGETVWSSHFGTEENDWLETIIPLSDGGIIGVGYIDVNPGPGTNLDFLVLKLNTAGELVWQTSYGSSSPDFAFDAVELGNGDLFIGGYSAGDNGAVAANYGGNDGWLIRLNAEGELLGEQNYGGTDTDLFHSMSMSPWGSLLIGGSTSSVDGDILSNQGDRDFWLLEVDMLGNIINSQTYGGSGFEYLNTISVSEEGEIYLSGKTDSSDGDVTQSFGGDDGWVLRVAYSCGEDIPIIMETGDGLLSVMDDFNSYQWMFNGEAIQGAISSSYQASEAGNYQAWGFGEQGCYSLSDVFEYNPVMVGLLEQDEASRITLYPNPAQDHIWIKGLGNAPFSYTIRTSDGRSLNSSWVSSQPIDLTSLTSGVYVVEVLINEVLFREKLLKE
jgi:hypothetical protein